MENPLFTFFIFVVVVFCYIHITSQWKTSDDLEIYEADYESAAQLQEICAVKQPVVFKFQIDTPADAFFEMFQSEKFEKYDNIDVRIKDRQDYAKDTSRQDCSIDFVPLSLRSARRLMTTDTTAKYFSENNQTFLEESGLDRISHSLDARLKPPLSAYTKYDILLGSPLVKTPLRYRLESHNFLAVARGKISVKLCPPKYSKIIPVNMDYENYEFWSPLNPGSNSPLKDKELLQKIKFLDVEVNTGDILFIPPYWWYSIGFSGDPETTVAGFTYDVVMNIASQAKHWGLYYLQQNNIKTRPAKTRHTNTLVLSADGQSSQLNTKTTAVKPETESTEPIHDVAGNKEIVTNAGTYIVDGVRGFASEIS